MLGPAFRRLWVASTSSNVGDGVLLAALPLAARSLSGDARAIAGVTVAATLPWLFFGLAAGVVVDRHDRVALMARVDAARAGVLAVVAVAAAGGALSLPVLYVAVFVLGVGETLFDTAAQTVVPAVVPPARLEEANGRLFGGQVAANAFVGPPLGSLLFVVGLALPFAFDAATFAASALLVAALPRRTTEAAAVARGAVRRELVEGLTWLWRHEVIRAFALGAAVVNVAYTAATAVLVLFARDVLGVGSGGYGLLLAGASLGAVAGTQVAVPVTRWLGRRRAVLSALATFSLALALAGAAPHAVAAAAALAVFGLAGEVWNVVAVSYRQARVPDHLLGRVMATYRFIAYGAMPTGAALGGAVAHLFGVRAVFAVGAALTAAYGFYMAATTSAAELELQPG